MKILICYHLHRSKLPSYNVSIMLTTKSYVDIHGVLWMFLSIKYSWMLYVLVYEFVFTVSQRTVNVVMHTHQTFSKCALSGWNRSVQLTYISSGKNTQCLLCHQLLCSWVICLDSSACSKSLLDSLEIHEWGIEQITFMECSDGVYWEASHKCLIHIQSR